MATVGVPLREVLRQLQAPAPAAALMGVAVLAVHWYLPWRYEPVLLLTEIAVGVAVYVALTVRETRRLWQAIVS
jgi:hypothetical protein